MWTPIEEKEILNLISETELNLDNIQFKIWNSIKIKPEKWSLLPWSDEGNGFWVVGIYNSYAIYYNDIEDGFNISEYREKGILLEYQTYQFELIEIINQINERNQNEK